MPARKGNELASWEVDAHSPHPVGETRVRRSYCSKELVLRPAKDVDTVHDIFLHAVSKYGDMQGFGKRDVLEVYESSASTSLHRASTHTPYSSDSELSIKTASSESFESPARSTQTDDLPTVGTSSKKRRYKLSPYNWMTYNEAFNCVTNLGSGLRRIGAGHHVEGSYFGLYGHTSRNWLMMAQACAFNAVPVCTLYDTLTPEALATTLAEARVPAIYVNADLLPNIVEALIVGATRTRQLHRAMNLEQEASVRIQLRMVVFDGTADEECLRALVSYGVKFMAFDDLRQLGKKFPVKARKANRDDVFCCMWTSGGTDRQKGVLLTHGNICSAVASVSLIADDLLANQEMYLAFLPQAHIFEFVVEMVFINVGLPIAYSSPATLTDAGVRGCKNDIMEARPTMMVAVPQVWEIMKKGIQRKVEESGGLRKSVFNLAVRAKSVAMEHSIPGVQGVTDAIVFNAVKKMTGGRLRTLMNGGGTVSRTTVQFLSAALVQMIQGYGLTEGTAQACILHPSWMNFNTAVGGPVPGVEMKLVDRKDLGYLASQNEGEVYIRGPCVFKGYFNRPDLDAEAFTPDGWFKTGDIGRWNKDGTLTVVDRVKNHVMLAEGYIALERLEAIYKGCGLVLNGCILASPTHKHPAMIAVAHPETLPIFARKNGVNGSLEELCNNPKVVALVLKELNAVAKKEGLKPMEFLEALVLSAEEWTPESGLLTAAQKLKRATIESHYAASIAKVYTLVTATAAPTMLAAAPSNPEKIPRKERNGETERYGGALPDESPTIGFQNHSRNPSELDLSTIDSVMVELDSTMHNQRWPGMSGFNTYPPVSSPKTGSRGLSVVPEAHNGTSPMFGSTGRSPRQPPSAWQQSTSPVSAGAQLDFIPYAPAQYDPHTFQNRVARSHSVDDVPLSPSRWTPTDNFHDELARQRAQSIPMPSGGAATWAGPRVRTGMYGGSPTSYGSLSPTSTTVSTPQSPEILTRPPVRTSSTSAKARTATTTRVGSPVTATSGNSFPPGIPNLTPAIPNLTPGTNRSTTPNIPNLTPGYTRPAADVPSRPRRPSQSRSASARPAPSSPEPSSPPRPTTRKLSLEKVSPQKNKSKNKHKHERAPSASGYTSAGPTVSMAPSAPAPPRPPRPPRRASDGQDTESLPSSPSSSPPKPSRSVSFRDKREVDARRLGSWMDDLTKYPMVSASASHVL